MKISINLKTPIKKWCDCNEKRHSKYNHFNDLFWRLIQCKNCSYPNEQLWNVCDIKIPKTKYKRLTCYKHKYDGRNENRNDSFPFCVPTYKSKNRRNNRQNDPNHHIRFWKKSCNCNSIKIITSYHSCKKQKNIKTSSKRCFAI